MAAIGFPALAQGEAGQAAPRPAAAAAADPPATASVIVQTVGSSGLFYDGSGSDTSDNQVEIVAGGKVTFSYPTGTLGHNVVFNGPQPTSCVQTEGAGPFPAPPLPQYTLPAPWAGDCTFDTPGTYAFHCNAHPEMTGSVVVDEPSGSPTPTPTGTATPTPTATATVSPTPTPSPPQLRPTSATIDAHDYFFQDAAAADQGDNTVDVQPGQSVKFEYPAGANFHNVEFNDSKPTTCEQTAGVVLPGIALPPLPAVPLGAGWSGQCEFDQPGTYTFFCTAHNYMTGTVVVGAPDGGGPPLAGIASLPDFLAPAPRAWVSFDPPRRASTTIAKLARGALKLTGHCTSVGDGKVTLTASKAQARRLHLRSRTLGTATAHCEDNGLFKVTIKSSAAVKRALKHYHGKALKVTATVTLRGAGGSSSSKRPVTLGGGK